MGKKCSNLISSKKLLACHQYQQKKEMFERFCSTKKFYVIINLIVEIILLFEVSLRAAPTSSFDLPVLADSQQFFLNSQTHGFTVRNQVNFHSEIYPVRTKVFFI